MNKKGLSLFLIFGILILSLVYISADMFDDLVGAGLSTPEPNESTVVSSDPLYVEMLKTYEQSEGNLTKLKEDVEKKIKDLNDSINQEDFLNFTSNSQLVYVNSVSSNTTKNVSMNEFNKISAEKQAAAKYGKKYQLSRWQKFLNSLNSWLEKFAGSVNSLTGNVISDFGYSNLDLPNYPTNPGSSEDVKPNYETGNWKIFNFITGHAIIGVPSWSFDGSKTNGDYIWKTTFSPKAGTLQHFELSMEANMSVPNAVNGIVFNKGYYLNENQGKWENFTFQGTRIGNTEWLREKGRASITLDNVTNNDYNIFLVYSCLKIKEKEWRCQEGKWTVFVVGTGNISYNQNIGETPTMQYTEIKDLNISDIPSILKQFNVSAFEFQPILKDALLISPRTNIQTQVGNVEKFDFYVMNLGNRNLSNLTFELDIGERVLADVLYADLPTFVAMNQTVKGSIDLRFKQRGNFKFNLYLKPDFEEVDTSDNMEIFNVTIGEFINVSLPQDSLNESWNRKINYTVKEEYSYNPLSRNSSLYIISGTNKMRTVFGGYYENRSINPTLKVTVSPLLVEEALFSTPYVATIRVGGFMETGDREVVNYYVQIVNNRTGKVYTTPVLESMYKYYFNPSEIIPDFELCTDYVSKVILVTGTNEQIDLIDPKPFNLCNYQTINAPPIAKFNSKGIIKLDGNYMLVTGWVNPDLFESTDFQFSATFNDSKIANKTYQTPFVDIAKGFGLFKISDVVSRNIDYTTGERFTGRIILNNSVLRDSINVSTKFGYMNYKITSKDGSISLVPVDSNFIWKGWNVSATSNSFDTNFVLSLRVVPIKIFSPAICTSTNARDWKTTISGDYSFVWPYSGNWWEYNMEYDAQYAALIKNETYFRVTFKDVNTGEVINSYEKKFIDWNGLFNPAFIKNVSFVNGHFYDIYFSVLGPHANKFSYGREPVRFFYMDGFQFVINNPLFRTRFMNLENTPDSLSFCMQNKAPVITISSRIKNTFRESDNKLSQLDVSQREIENSILPTYLNTAEDHWYYYYTPSFNFNYYSNQGNPSYVFSSTTVKIIAITNDTQITTSKQQFNCKLGKFDMVCYRSNSGYSINYVDEVNRFMYQLNFYDSNNMFLKKYRDNPKIYDAVIYDVLSEIDRNPIVDLEVPYNVVSNVTPVAGYFAFKSTNDFNKLNRLNNTLMTSIRLLPFSSSSFWCGVTCISRNYLCEWCYTAPNQVVNVKIADENKKDIISKSFNLTSIVNPSSFIFQPSFYNWLYALNLSDQSNYYFTLVPSNTSYGWIGYTSQVTLPKDYLKLLADDYSLYLRKISSINSTILGPYNSSLYNSTNYPLIMNGTLMFFPYLDQVSDQVFKYNYFKASFSVNPMNVSSFYPDEQTTLSELTDNTLLDRSLQLDSDRVYTFHAWSYNDLYEYYKNAPVNTNTYNTTLKEISCWSARRCTSVKSFNGTSICAASVLTLSCKWANINDLAIYQVDLNQVFLNKTANDLYNLNNSVLVDYRDNYAEPVLRKYLGWYPPTILANSTYTACTGRPNDWC